MKRKQLYKLADRTADHGSQSRHIATPINGITLVILIFITSICSAQTVFSTTYMNQAEVKVFVVKYESQADLKVFKVKYENQAEGNDGRWFFTKYENQARKKIFFVDYENQADLKIFFVDYESQAGWRDKSKKALLY